MDIDEGIEIVESSVGKEMVENVGKDTVVEPHKGMEFESEDAAKVFYDEYARQIGFVMRVMSCRLSERDGRILARRLGCNKEGYCVSIRGKFGNVRKPRMSAREGCKAIWFMLSLKSLENGW
ncbi:hypothetical protein BDE02_07G120600 [Populus trichocarpa]|nr:hypothetical protein BDE02_07G120600 [Populus trichocarpa]